MTQPLSVLEEIKALRAVTEKLMGQLDRDNVHTVPMLLTCIEVIDSLVNTQADIYRMKLTMKPIQSKE